MVKIGVIGYGYWGPNIVRNFHAATDAQVTMVCDQRAESLARVKRTFPAVNLTTNAMDVLRSPDVDAVAVVTPVWTHFDLAKAALENGKHVFVEKPFTSTTQQAEQLIELGAKKNLRIMVDHTFLFTGAVKKIHQLIEDGDLGTLYYYDSTRVNLGLFQHDVNVIWDLAPHDLAIMNHLIKDRPTAVVATGASHLNNHEDVAYITVYFQTNMVAHFNVNWLSPVKVRTTLIGGERRMVVWNDVEADEKVKVYDKGVEITAREGVYNLLVSYRSGDMWAPKVEQTEALKAECQYFVECVRDGAEPFNDGLAGLKVVQMLEAADRSVKARGRLVAL
jgi:predicted dehydrogenase